MTDPPKLGCLGWLIMGAIVAWPFSYVLPDNTAVIIGLVFATIGYPATWYYLSHRAEQRALANLQPPPPPGYEPGWRPDPTRRHELRYYDGGWTDHVSDKGTVVRDPV